MQRSTHAFCTKLTGNFLEHLLILSTDLDVEDYIPAQSRNHWRISICLRVCCPCLIYCTHIWSEAWLTSLAAGVHRLPVWSFSSKTWRVSLAPDESRWGCVLFISLLLIILCYLEVIKGKIKQANPSTFDPLFANLTHLLSFQTMMFRYVASALTTFQKFSKK